MENRRSNHFSGTEDGYCTCLALRGETYLKIFIAGVLWPQIRYKKLIVSLTLNDSP
jgi:hypothetical protein